MQRFTKITNFVGLALIALGLLGAVGIAARDGGVRFYELEGARNFRDFGGYTTKDGLQVRWELLYRSNQPAQMTAEDYGRVASLGLSAVVDFRTEEEREVDPTQWRGKPMPRFISLPMGETDGLRELEPLVEAAIAAEDLEQLRKVAVETYRRMPTEYAAEFGQLLRTLADQQSLPVMIHCHAGKDRTGIAAALVLSILDVPRETIMADYLYSNDLLLSEDDGRTAIEKLYWGVEPEWLQASFDSIESRFGSVDGYLEEALGIDTEVRAKIRSNLLR